jgi:hypothetical protein
MMELQRNKAKLEKGAPSDFWRSTLNQIPSVFGRLVYLSSLRDQNTGRYEHHGLAQMFGEGQTNAALRDSHVETFTEWLSFGLEQQKEDLDLYLSSFQADRQTILGTWIRLAPYRSLVPSVVLDPERRLYLSDLEALLEILKADYDVSAQD